MPLHPRVRQARQCLPDPPGAGSIALVIVLIFVAVLAVLGFDPWAAVGVAAAAATLATGRRGVRRPVG